jgi:hypothetical protein
MSNSLNIVDDPSEAEAADVVVCIELTQPLAFPDNIIDICSKCGRPIQYRPNAPKRPPKVCLPCVQPKLNRLAKKGELQVMITRKTEREVKAHIARKKAH